MSVGVLALIFWLATAGFGATLVLLWVRRALRRRRRRVTYSLPPPYIPPWAVVVHVSLAVSGLLAWAGAMYLLDSLAWAAVVALAGVALLGVGMFLRWLGSRRARQAARGLSGWPSESWLPTLVVIGHGMLGVTTMLLVALSFFRP